MACSEVVGNGGSREMVAGSWFRRETIATGNRIRLMSTAVPMGGSRKGPARLFGCELCSEVCRALAHADRLSSGVMLEHLRTVAEWTAVTLEMIGIALISILAIIALLRGGFDVLSGTQGDEAFRRTRHRLVRSILLGLEFLVAADIIHTVAVELTFESVGVLAIIVVIRTFLSFTLELEMTGRWPWQRTGSEKVPS